ncbi:MAG: hypothetical protein ACHQKZ_08295 [Solirubrobacterales bacterium]|jgi:hypothetical protein
MKERSDLPLGSIILIPGIITLAVTLLRLVGELRHWSPVFFNRDAGGPGAVVGIVWLVPAFGVYFALKLIRLGHGPASVGRAVGIPLLALLLLPVTVAATMKIELPFQIAAFGAGCVVGLLVAFRGWPALARTLFAYGLAARLPVALIMLLAIFGNWGTHYELGAPGFPEMAPFQKWLWIGLLPQMTLWMAFTVIVGALFGGLAALAADRRERAASAAVGAR